MVIISQSVTCPSCKVTLESGAVHPPVDGPTPGDFSVCWYCGYVAVYNDDLQLRDMTEDEKDSLSLDFWLTIYRALDEDTPVEAANVAGEWSHGGQQESA